MSNYQDILPVLQEYEAIGMKPKHICDLVGITETRMSRAKNGSEHLPGQDFLNVKNLLPDCQELARRNCLPVLWTDLRAVRRELELLRNEKNNPPSPLSSEEADILHRFARGEEIDILSTEAHQSADAFLKMISDLIQRANRLSQVQVTK